MAISAIAAIGSYLGASLAASAFLTGWAAVGAFALGAGLSMVSRALAPKPNIGAQMRGITQTTREPASSRKIIYGRMRVGGQVVFISNTGDDNIYLHMAIAFASHEIQAYDEIWFNDNKVWTASGGFEGDWGTYVTIDRKFGTAGQAASTQLTNANVLWTSNHKLSGIAYIAFSLKWDADKFPQGVPNITAVVRGKKVYDPRDQSIGYSQNPALCLRDYMLDQSYGLGEVAANINDQSVSDAANLCDEQVSLDAGGAQDRYKCNGVIDTANQIKANIEQLLSSMGGRLTYSGGEYFVDGAEYKAPTLTFTESDIISDIQTQTKQSRRGIYNGVKGIFVSEEKNFKVLDYPAQISSTYETEDGDPIYLDMPLPCVTNNTQAQRLAKIALLRSRQQVVMTMTTNLKGLRVKVGDTIQITNDRLSYSSKVFEVVDYSIDITDGALGVNLSCIETASAIYDWTTSDEEDFLSGGELDLYDGRTVANVTNLAFTETGFRGPDGGVISAVELTWDENPNAFVELYKIRYNKTGTTDYFYASSREPRVYISGLDITSNYDFRVKAENLIGVSSSGTTLSDQALNGDTTAPGVPTSGAATGGIQTIAAEWSNPTDLDFKHVEVYVNTTDSIPATPTAVVDGEEYIVTGLSGAATRYFWLKSVDFSGNKSDATASFSGTSVVAQSADVNLGSGDVGLGNVDNRDPQDQVETGIETGATVTAGGITLNGGGSIKGGQTEYDDADAAGFFLGYSGSAYKFSIGNSDNTKKLTFDGTDLAVAGEITATSGTIGGFTLGTQSITAGSGTSAVGIHTVKGIYLGATTFSSSPFRVNTAGEFTATNATITGSITATSLTLSGTSIAESQLATGVQSSLGLADSAVQDGDTGVNLGLDDGSIAGISINSTKLYAGTGTWANSNTGFYLDNTGKFSLKDKFFYNPSNNLLTVDGNITADVITAKENLVVLGDLEASSMAAGSITRAMFSQDALDEIYSALATSVGGSNGDYKEDSGSFTTSGGTVTVGTSSDKFDHGTADVVVEFLANHYFYTTTNYTTAQAQATLNFEVSADGTFTDLTSATKTETLQFGEYDLSSYYGYTYLVYFFNGEHNKTFTTGSGNDIPDDTELQFRVRVSGVGTAFTSQTVPFTVEANEGVTGVVSTGGNADTLDNLDSTKFLRSDVDDTFNADLTITGDLSLQGALNITGDINSYNVTDLDVSDKTITVNSGNTQSLSDGAGLIVDRGTAADASITWDETNDEFDFTHAINTTALGVNTTPSYTVHAKGTTLTNAIVAVESSSWATGATGEIRLGYVAAHNRSIKGHYDNGLEFYTNPSSPVLTLDANAGNATFTGTLASGAITSSGSVTWSGGSSTNANTAYSKKINTISFASANGNLTLTRQDGTTASTNLDGRYLTSYTETDTLDSVTDRGATTTNAISTGAISATGSNNVYAGTFTGGSGPSVTSNGVKIKAGANFNDTTLLVEALDGTDLFKIDGSGVGEFSQRISVQSQDVTGTRIQNWQTAYGWGDHSTQGYLTAEADTLSTVTGRGATTSHAISTGSITTSGTINGSLNQNSGYVHKLTNTSTGTSAYTEFTVESGSQELRVGTSQNYSSGQWDGSWIYAAAGDLFLKSGLGHVKIYAGDTVNPRWTFNTDGSIKQGDYNGSTFVDSSRNITAGTISSGALTTTGTVLINDSIGSSSTTAMGNFDRLKFSNSFSDVMRGPNKILMYESSGWVGGFGIADGQVTYSSGGDHIFYSSQNSTTYDERFKINDDGDITVNRMIIARSNSGTSAPTNSDHTLGTRIKFYDNGSANWYAQGIENDTMWFTTYQQYKWYQGQDIKMTLDSDRLGIATTPHATDKLRVGGNISQSAGSIFAFGDLVIGQGALKKGSTTLIDASSNLINIGTISSGAISTTGDFTLTKSGSDAVIEAKANGSNDPILNLRSTQGSLLTEGFQIWYDNSVGDVHIHTTYPNDAAAIRFHTRTGTNKATNNERFTIQGNGDFDFHGGDFSNVGAVSSGAITSSGNVEASTLTGTSVIQADRLGTATSSSNQFNSADIRLYASGWDTNNSLARTVGWKIRNIPTASNYPDHDLHFIEDDQGTQYTKFSLHGRGSVNHTDPRAGTFFGNLHVEAGSGTNAGNGDITSSGVLTINSTGSSNAIVAKTGSLINFQVETYATQTTLRTDSTDFYIWQPNSGYQFRATNNGAVYLSYDGSTRLTTSSAGVSVTGTISSGAITSSGKLEINQAGNGTTNVPSSVAEFSGQSSGGVLKALSLVNSVSASFGNGTEIAFHNASNYSPTGTVRVIQAGGTITDSKMVFQIYRSGLRDAVVIDHDENMSVGGSITAGGALTASGSNNVYAATFTGATGPSVTSLGLNVKTLDGANDVALLVEKTDGTDLFKITGQGVGSFSQRISVQSQDITGTRIQNWQTAYGWGDHSSAGYLTGLPTNISVSGYLNVGTRIGTISPSLTVSGATNSVPFAAKSGSYSTVFSVLPWSDAITYLASGTYYQGSSWVHASPNDFSCLLGISGKVGAKWYVTSNGSGGSWNHVSNLQLWNNSGVWTSAVNTGSTITSAGAVTAGNSSTTLGYYVGTTQVIQGSTRNLVNIGTITAGLTKLTPSGYSAPQGLAALNIGRNGAGETRAIDIWGSWSPGESKSITFNHGGSSTQMVGQINVAHKPTTNTTGSSFRWGKLYHNGDSSTYTMELHSESQTLANLYINAGMVQIGHDDTYSNYGVIGFSGRGNGANRIFGHNGSADGLYLNSATGRQISFRVNGSNSDAFTMDASGYFKVAGTTVIDSSRNLTNVNISRLTTDNYSPYLSPTNTNTLNAGYGNSSDSADMWINYRGYNDGFANFRDFRIGNGKGISLLHVDGSNKNFNFNAGANLLVGTNKVWHAGNDGSGSGLDADKLDNLDSSQFEAYRSYTVNMSNTSTYAENTYYPVTIPISNGRTTRLRVEVALNSGSTPSWDTHPSGFTILLDWSVNGSGWGTTYVSRTIHSYTERWTSSTICGGISQMTNSSTEVVYLRGGGTYYIKANYLVTPTGRSSTFTENSQSVSPTTTAVNNVWDSATQAVGVGKLYSKGNIDIDNGAYMMDGTTVIDSSRNITAGTISSGAITSSGSVSAATTLVAPTVSGGQFRASFGSMSAPAYTFKNDDDTGFYGAAGTVYGVTGGQKRLTLNANGVSAHNDLTVLTGNLKFGTQTVIDASRNITANSVTIDPSVTYGTGLTINCGDNNNASGGAKQIILSFGGTSSIDYAHSIRTRHDSGSAEDNAIEFWLWNHGVDNSSTLGSLKALELDAGLGLSLLTGGYRVGTTTVIDASRNITGQSVLVNNGLTVRNGNTSVGYKWQSKNHVRRS